MSSFSETCDGLIEDLLDNVPTLMVDPQNIHRYLAWMPEALVPDGARHLAVYPGTSPFDQMSPIGASLGSLERRQSFEILVWEPSGTESSRQVSEEQETKVFLDLYEAILARMFVAANQPISGGAYRQWVTSATVPTRSSQVRWFGLLIERASRVAFT